MPWGSRPSIAALTRLGARNASGILMFTLRALHPLALGNAFRSGFSIGRESSSQRRPRAINATNVARFSSGSGEAAAVEFLAGAGVTYRPSDNLFRLG